MRFIMAILELMRLINLGVAFDDALNHVTVYRKLTNAERSQLIVDFDNENYDSTDL